MEIRLSIQIAIHKSSVGMWERISMRLIQSNINVWAHRDPNLSLCLLLSRFYNIAHEKYNICP